MSFYRYFWLIMLIFALTSSCGFKPLYKELNDNDKINGKINVASIGGKSGYYLREEIARRFGEAQKDAYNLEIKISISKSSKIITPANEITSYNLVMNAEYSLKGEDGTIIIPKQNLSSKTGYSAATNMTGYATQIAEEAAKKRLSIDIGNKIITRLLISSKDWKI